ncbi:GrlR family regulatory protein [Tardiphaga sp. 42S5]|uniref:GrlR family regulatory protein n=1 Tax=Tardiphaga sp. 42S5 TaxID=1404799 RepID=UPI002A599DCB|nr:GrlR family regulatory protein [Tardiphaga sp. 42S5]WPO40319.1 GrlR family regulatory protein [Tardiphaga sp. 42S5]
MPIANGLYSIRISMDGEDRRRASGIINLQDGALIGGDSFFYYTGIFDAKNGRWRGELMTRQHTDAPGKNLLFGGREVSCGFSGSYAGKIAKVEGTALVGKVSVAFRAELQLLVPMAFPLRSGPV